MSIKQRRPVIGVTGSMQSGKQELAETWKGLGCEFVDLNVFADRARVKHRDRYRELGLEIGSDGKKTGSCYTRILNTPSLHREVMKIEIPFVINELRRHLGRLPSDGEQPIIVSWGYVYQLLDFFSFDHVVLCEPNHKVWVARIQRRAEALGWVNLSRKDVERLADTIEMNPHCIRKTIEDAYPFFTHIDTSADDWGAADLIRNFPIIHRVAVS